MKKNLKYWPVEGAPDDIHPLHQNCCEATIADVWWDLFGLIWYRIGHHIWRNQRKDMKRGESAGRV